MKEKIITYKDTVKSFWAERSKGQKGIFLSSAAIIAALILIIILFSSDSKFVPLYNDLSVQEVSQIKTELDSRSVPYELDKGGKTIKVPESDVDSLLVDLAGQGIPNSGSIDYSFFSENASWGITDNEFSMIKLDAMQTELANLIKGVEGVKNAKVMINKPEEPVFVSETKQEGSASIVIHTEPGYDIKGKQMNALYHLVSKAVPNLSQENVAIMNQYFEYFDKDSSTANGNEQSYTHQQNVKQNIEKNIKRRLQQMLGAMVGRENVIVSVTADVDFTQENRVEKLVEPVDVENMEGVPVSIESIEETYEGKPPAGGEAGTGDEDIPNYEAAEEGNGNGDYDVSKEKINNDYNRIRKEIAESPYKVRDLGIQVAVDEVKDKQDGDVQYLSSQEQETVSSSIASILDSMISTSINGEYEKEVEPEEKTSIVFQEFSERIGSSPQSSAPVVPLWTYAAGGALIIIIIVLMLMLLRKRKNRKEETPVQDTVSVEAEKEVPETDDTEDSESAMRNRQLEKMAKESPEEFAKLLRSWISDD